MCSRTNLCFPLSTFTFVEEVILGVLVVAWFVTVLIENSMATEMVQYD